MRSALLLLATVILAGCSSTSVSRYGEARLKRTERFTAFDLMLSAKVVYQLDFPPVPLTQPGTTIFRVKGIKPGMVPRSVSLRYPRHSNLGQRDMLDQWGDGMFRLRITSVGRDKQFSHTFDLAETNWDYDSAISDQAHFKKSLTGYPLNKKFQTEEWSKVTDYDVEVTVLKPTQYGSHKVELAGVLYDFMGEPKIKNAQQDAP